MAKKAIVFGLTDYAFTRKHTLEMEEDRKADKAIVLGLIDYGFTRKHTLVKEEDRKAA